MSYTVKLETFEGPLDLLLYLIKQSKLEIADISLSDITHQYLDYILNIDDKNMDSTSEFLVTAATLLEIKSRALLPKTVKIEEAELSQEDIEQSLKARLQTYNVYKEAAQTLRVREQYQQMIFNGPSRYTFKAQPVCVVEINATIEDIFNCYHKLLNEKNTEYVYKVQSDSVSLEEQISIFRRLLMLFKRFSFSSIIKKYKHRKERLVVSFLSILELMKNGEADAYQVHPFAELVIRFKRTKNRGANRDYE